MTENKIDRILKLMYFFQGVDIAIFGFIISLLIEVDNKPINIILSVSLGALLCTIFIIMYFILALTFKPGLLEKEMIRKLVGSIGFMTGIILASLLIWLFVYRGLSI